MFHGHTDKGRTQAFQDKIRLACVVDSGIFYVSLHGSLYAVAAGGAFYHARMTVPALTLNRAMCKI
mgnify:CR=1 FL=1